MKRSLLLLLTAIICFASRYESLAQNNYPANNIHTYKKDLNTEHNKDFLSPEKLMSGNNGIASVDSVPFLLQLDSLISYFADPDSSNLTNQERTSFKYDSNNRVNEEVISEWDQNNNSWLYYSKKTFVYDPSGDVDTNTIYMWDTVNLNWKGQYKHEYAYASGSISMHVFYTWDSGNSVWVGSAKDEYTYDGNSNVTNYTRSTWDAGNTAWLYNFKYDKSYDTNNNDTSSVRSVWNTNSSSWINYSKLSNTYNGSNKLINTTAYLWDTINNIWYNDQKIDLYYTTAYADSSISYSWNTNSMQWYISGQELFGYDGNFNVITDQNNTWDTTSNVYTNSNLRAFSFDGSNNKLSETYFIWDGAEWMGTDSLVYTDFTGIYAGSTYDYYYDFGSMMWLPATWDSKIHDSNFSFTDIMLPYYYNMEDFHHKLDFKINHSWDDVNAMWHMNTVAEYFYSDPNAQGLENLEAISFAKIYPNPFSNELTITVPDNSNTILFKLYDVAGRCVYETKSAGSININNELTQGIYFYTAQSVGQTYTGKLIKE